MALTIGVLRNGLAGVAASVVALYWLVLASTPFIAPQSLHMVEAKRDVVLALLHFPRQSHNPVM
jgi:tellurite resistance-related uncharacterized protein